MFSERTAWPLHESAWSAAASAARKRGALDLTETNPTRCSIRYPVALLQPFSSSDNLSYEPDPQGLGPAREAVAAYYREKGADVSAGRIFLTAGTSEAYSYLFKLLVEPGGSVLVPEPGYPLLDHLAGLSDARIVRYALGCPPGGGWVIDRKNFLQRLTAGARAVVVVHPNNPTGHFTTEEDRLWLESIAAERGIALIADEVFLDFPFDPQARPRSFADTGRALTFTLSGISKMLGLPQMKLSWMVLSGPEELVQGAFSRMSVIADAFLSVSGPPQRALPGWMALRGGILAEIGGRVRQNRTALSDALKNTKISMLAADGGWVSVLRFEGPETDEAFSLSLMERGVLTQPGYLFDLPEHHLVVSLLLDPAVFNEGIRRLLR